MVDIALASELPCPSLFLDLRACLVDSYARPHSPHTV